MKKQHHQRRLTQLTLEELEDRNILSASTVPAGMIDPPSAVTVGAPQTPNGLMKVYEVARDAVATAKSVVGVAPDHQVHATGLGPIVAIADTGVDFGELGLVGRLYVNPGEIAGNGIDDDVNGYTDDVNGYDFHAKSGEVSDEIGHGTAVSKRLASVLDQNALPGDNVRMMILKVTDEQGNVDRQALIEAVGYARELGATPVNLSLRLEKWTGAELAALTNAAGGITVTVAAGNDGQQNHVSLGLPDNFIFVAAARHDALADFSRRGAGVHLAADADAGTSEAAPQVAAAVALLKAQQPELANAALVERVFQSVDHLPALQGLVATGGRLNVGRVLGLPASVVASHASATGEVLQTGGLSSQSTTTAAATSGEKANTSYHIAPVGDTLGFFKNIAKAVGNVVHKVVDVVKAAPKFVADVGTGFAKAAVETVKGTVAAIKHPVTTVKAIGASIKQTVKHPVQTGKAAVNGTIQAFKSNPGETIGRLAFQVATRAAGTGAGVTSKIVNKVAVAGKALVTTLKAATHVATSVGQKLVNAAVSAGKALAGAAMQTGKTLASTAKTLVTKIMQAGKTQVVKLAKTTGQKVSGLINLALKPAKTLADSAVGFFKSVLGPIEVLPGHGKSLPGDPTVYFGNGVATTRAAARVTGDSLEKHLFEKYGKQWPVSVIHNPTAGLPFDLVESAGNKWLPAALPFDATVRKNVQILMEAFQGDKTIAFVNHSQFNLQFQDAMELVAAKGPKYKAWIETKVALVSLGSPVNPHNWKIKPNSFASVGNQHDPVYRLIGGNHPSVGNVLNAPFKLSDHAVKNYIPLISPEMLTPSDVPRFIEVDIKPV